MPRPPLSTGFAPLLLVSALLSAGCGKSDRSAAGPSVLTIASAAEADALIPPLVGTTQGKQVVDLLFDYLATPAGTLETLGDRGFRPQLATSWSWAPDSLSIAFTLDPRARWHDGTPVRAQDVRFSLALFTDSVVASPHATDFAGIDSVTVRDSLTAVVWWGTRHPEQFFQVAFNLAVLPEHLLAKVPRDSLAQSAYAQHPVGSGRYRFERWTHQQQLVLAADSTNYRGRPGFDHVVWIVTADPNAANMSVLSGQADVLESVRGDAFAKASASASLHTVEYGSLDYAFMVFNEQRTVSSARQLFGDRALRVAFTALIDRAAVVSNVLDSLGAVALGPFTRAQGTVDTAMRQIAFDSAAAGRLLDSLGWKRGATDGLRRRNGALLSFELLVPASSATRQRLAVLLQEQFRHAGVQVTVAPVEPGLFSTRLEHGEFDAALNMWRADPSPNTLRQVWGSPRGRDIGANFGRYSNRSFDAVLDSATRAFDPAMRQRQFRRAYQMIVDDAPAVWLYEPRNFAAINRRVATVGMRADAWWANLAEWHSQPASGAK